MVECLGHTVVAMATMWEVGPDGGERLRTQFRLHHRASSGL